MRRFIREGYVRYAFTRFGVPCGVDPVPQLDTRARRLACREAYPVAEHFLKALRIAGGLPSRPRRDISSDIAARPIAASPEFTYRPSGEIIAHSGARKQGGRADLTAYSQVRFPLEKAPGLRPFAVVRARRQTQRTTVVIPCRAIFARRAALKWANAPPVSATRRGYPSRPSALCKTAKTPVVAIPSGRRWLRFATAC